jgi:hypothetical protein
LFIFSGSSFAFLLLVVLELAVEVVFSNANHVVGWSGSQSEVSQRSSLFGTMPSGVAFPKHSNFFFVLVRVIGSVQSCKIIL